MGSNHLYCTPRHARHLSVLCHCTAACKHALWRQIVVYIYQRITNISSTLRYHVVPVLLALRRHQGMLVVDICTRILPALDSTRESRHVLLHNLEGILWLLAVLLPRPHASQPQRCWPEASGHWSLVSKGWWQPCPGIRHPRETLGTSHSKNAVAILPWSAHCLSSKDNSEVRNS